MKRLNRCSGYRPAWGGGFTFEEKHDIGQFYKHLKCYRKETLWKQRWPSQHLHQQESTPFFSVFECFADRVVCFVFFWGCDIEWFTQGHMYAKKLALFCSQGEKSGQKKVIAYINFKCYRKESGCWWKWFVSFYMMYLFYFIIFCLKNKC